MATERGRRQPNEAEHAFKAAQMSMENYIYSKLQCNFKFFFTRHLYKAFKMN